MSYWLIAVPNDAGQQADITFRTLDERTKQYSKNHPLKIPSLKVGTLDTLMALSDDLAKYDALVGGISKKIEKTYLEIYKNEPAESKNAETPELRVGQQTARDYVEKFKWNDKRYRDPATLRNISDSILKEAMKADEVLKKQVSEYNEVRAAVTALERKDTGSLLVRSLAPYVKEKDIIEKEFLTTLLVVVPKAKDLEFIAEYEILEDKQEKKEQEEKKRKEEEAAARAEKDRQAALDAANKENKQAPASSTATSPTAKKTTTTTTTTTTTDTSKDGKPALKKKASVSTTSKPKLASTSEEAPTSSPSTEEKGAAPSASAAPTGKSRRGPEEKKTQRLKSCRAVVPSSAKKLTEDDEYILYRIVILKNGADHYKNLLRERRYTNRPFKYDPDEEKKSKEEKTALQKKKTALWNYLVRWCTTTYAEIFASWIHIKAIRLYVEAVLRYGLPVNLSFAVMEPRKGYDKQVRDTLQILYAKLASANLTQALDANETDLSGFGSDFYPYVYLPLALYD